MPILVATITNSSTYESTSRDLTTQKDGDTKRETSLDVTIGLTTNNWEFGNRSLIHRNNSFTQGSTPSSKITEVSTMYNKRERKGKSLQNGMMKYITHML